MELLTLFHVLGTQKYLAPEDATHLVHDIGHTADHQAAGNWRIPVWPYLPVETLKFFDPSFSLTERDLLGRCGCEGGIEPWPLKTCEV